jgi:hypothetical protein
MDSRKLLIQSLGIIGIMALLLALSPGCGPVLQSVPKEGLDSGASPMGAPLMPGPSGNMLELNENHPRSRAIALFRETLRKKDHSQISSQLEELEAAGLRTQHDAITATFIGGQCGEQKIDSDSDSTNDKADLKSEGTGSCEFTYLVSQEFGDGSKFRSISIVITASTDLDRPAQLKTLFDSALVEGWL